MNEEKHVLAKLENIYFGKKENEKLTMHEIGVVLDYVALLEQKSKQLQQKENIIKEVREYITSYESIETIQQFDHNKNNKDLDYLTMDEMTRRYMIVHDKVLEILDKGNKNDK